MRLLRLFLLDRLIQICLYLLLKMLFFRAFGVGVGGKLLELDFQIVCGCFVGFNT